jgi:cysteine synthase
MSILPAIGNTPLIELTNLNSKKPDVKILGKFAGANPGGSVKDHAAYWIIIRKKKSCIHLHFLSHAFRYVSPYL